MMTSLRVGMAPASLSSLHFGERQVKRTAPKRDVRSYGPFQILTGKKATLIVNTKGDQKTLMRPEDFGLHHLGAFFGPKKIGKGLTRNHLDQIEVQMTKRVQQAGGH